MALRGWCAGPWCWWLTQDAPQSSRVASAAARSGSALHTAHRAVQPEAGVIGPRERVLDIAVRHDRQYRPELLLSDDPHPPWLLQVGPIRVAAARTVPGPSHELEQVAVAEGNYVKLHREGLVGVPVRP